MDSDTRRNTVQRVIGPGLWIDLDGNPHINLAAVCEAVGLEPTLENLAMVQVAAIKVLRLAGFARDKIKVRACLVSNQPGRALCE